MQQPDLFQHVANVFLEADGPVVNADLYASVAAAAGVTKAEANKREPVGKAGKPRSLFQRAVRWHTQTLKQMGVVEPHPGQRGTWRLAMRNKSGLHEAGSTTRLVAFSTNLGVAIWGRCESVLAGLDCPVTCIITSPPYLLRSPRAYGGPADEQAYIDFVCRSLEPIIAHLAPGGSLCLNTSNDTFEPGSPARSLVRERLLIALCDRYGLQRMDTIIWWNPSKPPAPVQWASKRRIQLNTAWEPIDWLTNDPSRITADNRRVLEAHTQRHLRLMQSGGEGREASYGDGAYRLRPGGFGKETPGRIPRNVIRRGHRCADSDHYRGDAQALGLPVHGAMQPIALADFLIRFLSEVGDLVVDPFGGTVKTGMAAERLGRRWIVVESMLDYLRAAGERFRACPGFRQSIADLP